MFGNNNPQQEKNRKVFSDSLNGFATTIAIMASVLGAPYLHELTVGYVVGIAERSYPSEIVDLVSLVWMIACFPFVFFAARASIGVALTVAGSAVAYRLI